MSRQKIKNKKKRNVKGRKSPSFASMVLTMLKDATVTVDELMEASPTKTLDEDSGRFKVTYDQLPEGTTTIHSLNGTWAFNEARLFRHIDRIDLAMREFGAEFWDEDGAPLMELRFDRKGRVWGDEIAVCGLAYLAIGAGLATWTEARDAWEKNSDKMPKIKFISEKTNKKEDKHETSETKIIAF